MGQYREGGVGDCNMWFESDSQSVGAKPGEIDGHLASAGYRVRSSDLTQVAQQLERLESTMVSAGATSASTIANDQPHYLLHPAGVVHYNPSDLASWVDSLLSDISPTPNNPATRADLLTINNNCHVSPPQHVDEDSGIQLVHLLMTCAEAVQRNEATAAASLLDEMRSVLSRVSTTFGIGKVAGYFMDALTRRLYYPHFSALASSVEGEILYHNFYEACPYLKFAHFTANQAILEAFDGHDHVHVIDFSLMQGLQWPALIQALALRPGGPPFLRLTGIGPPSSDGRDSLREIGLRLAELARSVGVRFAFRGVAANRLDDVCPWMLHVTTGLPVKEAVAVNSVMQLHRLLRDETDSSRVDFVLNWIQDLKPKIMTLVEQEADHNKVGFLDRFTEALFYYSTMFDSLDAGAKTDSSALAEIYLQREICNVLCCEGESRTERHEPLSRWRNRMTRAGFRPTHLGSNAFKQASMLLTLFSGDGYCVDEVDGCLSLGWHSRPLISASAWTAEDVDDGCFTTSGLVRSSNGSGIKIGVGNYDGSSSSGSGMSSSTTNISNR